MTAFYTTPPTHALRVECRVGGPTGQARYRVKRIKNGWWEYEDGREWRHTSSLAWVPGDVFVALPSEEATDE